MSSTATSTPNPWALGDYHRFAKQTVWQLGPRMVAACAVREGERVLDVAAGTGNVAVRAAKAGARVVACDLTPQHFAAGRAEAAAHGVEVEWVEGDAQALPFPDGVFDVVCSVFGAMFAADHEAVAAELLRVCRPGGRIGLMGFTPEGAGGQFFEVLGRYAPPPPPDAASPLSWGREAHVRRLLEPRAEVLRLERQSYVERVAGGPAGYWELCRTGLGPVAATWSALVAGDPARAAALERDFLAFAAARDRGAPGGPAELEYEYLLAVARRRADGAVPA